MARKTSKKTGFTEDEEIVKEARERLERGMDWEATARSRYLEDIKFYNGDADNGFQWPLDVRKNRDVDKRPVLTINKTRQYCLNITNDAKQNKPSVKVRPVGNEATQEGAEVMEGIIRHVEYQSNAQAVYDNANGFQVQGGVGYWRVLTRYADPDSFDQDLFIEGVKDPLSVVLDPDTKEPDKCDMNWGFIFEDVAKDKFDYEYPDAKDKVGSSNLGDMPAWIDEYHVRVCEYYRRKPNKSKLIAMTDPTSGEQVVIRTEKVPSAILKEVLADPLTKTREVIDWEVEWFKIAGDVIVERSTWVGTTIPIVQIIGEESIIEGVMDRKGHVRALKDPQRIYNYWSSSAVEAVALQSKTPYIGPARAIEGYETYWQDANTVNHAILPYNDVDDAGLPIAKPERQNPPVMPQAYMQGLQISAEEMRMASGQYQADLGEPGNERSGKAINARQRAGDNATYHFVDNQAIGIRYTGKILIEAIPKIYDTKRTLKILGEDGIESEVLIDPKARSEYVEQQQKEEDKVKIIFNPSFAKYSVESDIGPAYATRRQEAFNAFTQIMAQNPDLMKVAGDLMFRAADFPMADELAERLKRMVPPAILGKGPDPQMQQLMQQNQQLTQHIQTLLQQYAEERGKQDHLQHKSETDAFNAATKRGTEEQQKQIDEYRAETDRLKLLMSGFDPKEIASLTAQLVLATLQTPMPAQASFGDGGLSPALPPAAPVAPLQPQPAGMAG